MDFIDCCPMVVHLQNKKDKSDSLQFFVHPEILLVEIKKLIAYEKRCEWQDITLTIAGSSCALHDELQCDWVYAIMRKEIGCGLN